MDNPAFEKNEQYKGNFNSTYYLRRDNLDSYTNNWIGTSMWRLRPKLHSDYFPFIRIVSLNLLRQGQTKCIANLEWFTHLGVGKSETVYSARIQNNIRQQKSFLRWRLHSEYEIPSSSLAYMSAGHLQFHIILLLKFCFLQQRNRKFVIVKTHWQQGKSTVGNLMCLTFYLHTTSGNYSKWNWI